jgi:hypothetical protein
MHCVTPHEEAFPTGEVVCVVENDCWVVGH